MQVHADFGLAVGGVLQGVVPFHLGHLGVVHHQLPADVGRQVGGGFPVRVLGLGIQVREARRLVALAPAAPDAEPFRHLQRAVETRGEGRHLFGQPRLHHVEADAALQLEFHLQGQFPGEVVLQVGRHLAQGRDVEVGAGTAVAVGPEGKEVVVVGESAGLVGLIAVFRAHVEALLHLLGVDGEHVAGLGEEVQGLRDGAAAGPVRTRDVGDLVVAVGEGGDDGQAAVGGDDARGPGIGVRQGEAQRIGQGAGERLVQRQAAVVREAQGILLLPGFRAFDQEVRVGGAEVDDAAEIDLGGRGPDPADGVAVGDAAADAVEGAVLRARVSRGPGVVGVDIQAAGILGKFPALAEGAV